MIVPLDLGTVALPTWHPRSHELRARLRGYAIIHPDGVIVVDTGCGTDDTEVNESYRPAPIDVIAALNKVGIDERAVGAVVNTHLHFDHCGQNDRLPWAPVWITADEASAAAKAGYSVRRWTDIPMGRRRLAGDGEEIAPGVRLVATPGHTPGHQSVVVTGFDTRPELVVGQACYDCAEFAEAETTDGNLHEAELRAAGRSSLLRLRSLRPSSAYFAHDSRIYCSP